ncbi:hypothetical protein MLD38_013566 [Melastoma candidum]|uniref:Uncharacterized protein n=1 Tax=Melastoma candidum TaxID=119954 RepID=A0ACB9RA52_9MYRT|nr:hypothetical protein MLD38_013566 [Melastoma candidum]
MAAAAFLYHLFAAVTLISLGLHHLVSTTRNFLKSPTAFLAKPYHPFPSSDPRLKHLPLYLTALSLLAASFRYALSSSLSDPLIRGSSPVHHFLSLLTSSVLLLFLLLTFLPLFPLVPSDLVFASAAAAFFLLSSASSAASSALLSLLQAKLFSTSSLLSLLSSLSCLILSLRPSSFVADVVLAASVCLQGFWNLQTGLSLYVESFIPEGCHLLLDVASGVEGSTKCDVEESGLRAAALLDVVFVGYVIVVVLIAVVVYAFQARGLGIRRLGSYEALSTNGGDGEIGHGHGSVIQMKALTGTQA